MNKAILLCFVLITVFTIQSWSDDSPGETDHSHSETQKDQKLEEAHEAHDDDDDHHHDERHPEDDSHAQENPNIGPGKGITETNPEQGFKISPEALKNFNIQTKTVSDSHSLTIPKAAVFSGLLERNLYRVRNGFFKRIDFETKSKTASDLTVSSASLKTGDEIVISGLGFLRIVELAAFGGVSDSHSH